MIMLNVLIMSIGIVMAFAFGLYVCVSEGGGFVFCSSIGNSTAIQTCKFCIQRIDRIDSLNIDDYLQWIHVVW